MAGAELPTLRDAFDEAFIAPFATHEWESPRGRSHWVALEGWQDSLAGPLSAIAQTGGCEYVYIREDWSFSGVSDPTTLQSRLLEWLAALVAGVESFIPTTPEEAADLAFMRAITEQMRTVVKRACEIERARWSAESDQAHGEP